MVTYDDIGEPSHPAIVAQLKKGRTVLISVHDEDSLIDLNMEQAIDLRDWLNRAIAVMEMYAAS